MSSTSNFGIASEGMGIVAPIAPGIPALAPGILSPRASLVKTELGVTNGCILSSTRQRLLLGLLLLLVMVTLLSFFVLMLFMIQYDDEGVLLPAAVVKEHGDLRFAGRVPTVTGKATKSRT